MTNKKLPQPNKECEYCNGYGILVSNPNYKEQYGDPYRPSMRQCDGCNGVGWVVKNDR